MHPYATDSNERSKVNAGVAFLSVLAAWLLNRNISFPWWIDAPSVWGFFALFYAVFDHHLWKWKLFRRAGIIAVPDLNGSWQGRGASSYDNHQSESELFLEIRQTWTHLSVVLKSPHSRSCSAVGALLTSKGCGPVLIYEYLNEPRPAAAETRSQSVWPSFHLMRRTLPVRVPRISAV